MKNGLQPHIPIHLSMDDPQPMYRQIESQLKDFILSSLLKPGAKLPSVRALASDLSCSVITTRRAYQDLEGGGFIRSRQGLRAVVTEISEEKMSAHRRQPVEAAFGEAVRAGRLAGLTEDELRDIFEETLQRDDTNVHQGLRGGTP